MAARTLTYTLNMAGPLRGNHVGINTLTFDCNSGATKFGTVSDVFLLGKIPTGATIVGGGIQFGISGAAAATYTLMLLSDEGSGTYSAYATLATVASLTANASTVQNYALPSYQKVSYSDDRAIRYATLALNCTVGPSETVSVSFQGFINYVVDGRTA